MKRIFLVVVALLLSASAAFGAFGAATTQKWTAGWDILTEPLDYKTSNISWSVNTTTSKLSVTFTLKGATPNKLYQVGINFFCTTFPATFGQFPNDYPSGNCTPEIRQGASESVSDVEVGVVTTDINGDGSFRIVIGPIAAGTYDVEFKAIGGAGCDLIGGGSGCGVVFQSPGPTFGDATTITIP